MTNLSSEICFAIKQARRAAKLSQSVVAQEIGCKQSALSMFEQGDGRKLNDEVIERLAKKFGISLTSPRQGISAGGGPGVTGTTIVRGFCPNPHCPSHERYEVEGRIFLRPDRSAADPVGGRYCALCGEVLEKRCPNCGQHLHDGAVCSYCGESYVALAQTEN